MLAYHQVFATKWRLVNGPLSLQRWAAQNGRNSSNVLISSGSFTGMYCMSVSNIQFHIILLFAFTLFLYLVYSACFYTVGHLSNWSSSLDKDVEMKRDLLFYKPCMVFCIKPKTAIIIFPLMVQRLPLWTMPWRFINYSNDYQGSRARKCTLQALDLNSLAHNSPRCIFIC